MENHCYRRKRSLTVRRKAQLLTGRINSARTLYDDAIKRFPRNIVARDDIVDTLMCLVIAEAPATSVVTIPHLVTRDPRGLKMAIHYLPEPVSY